MRLDMMANDFAWLAVYDDDTLLLNMIEKLQNGPGFAH